MSPQIASLICILTILYLFWVDRKNSDGYSKAIWIPLIWMFFAGSRYPSQWLDYNSHLVGTDAYLDGSPLDRVVFLGLIVAGSAILLQRRAEWGRLIAENKWVWLFFLFGLLSVSWSDFPFVSFKRWVKAMGNLIMVLVILTEKRPYEAVGVILRRLAFVLVPLSVLFVKYYPELGRAYHMGQPMFTGVSTQKNGLGLICLIAGCYFLWTLLYNSRKDLKSRQRHHYTVYLLLLPMTVWLFYMADSATSLGCMVVSIAILGTGCHPAVAKEPVRILKIGTASVILFVFMETVFDLKTTVIMLLGREPDLTTRVPIWEGLLGMVKNPLLGFGFGGFWLGDRATYAKQHFGVATQAHNGYLQMYLDLGIIGLAFLLTWVLSGLRKVARHLTLDYSVGILRLCVICVVLLYNWTEATFYGVSNMWILLFLGVMSIPDKDKDVRPS